jgi:hypothetical protein
MPIQFVVDEPQFEATLQYVTNVAVTAIPPAAVRGVQLLHHPRNRKLRRSDYEVNVRFHQTECCAGDVKPRSRESEELGVAAIVGVICENCVSVIAA